MDDARSVGPTKAAWTGPELHVLDGTAHLFRAYYGMTPRSSTDGLEVGAVLGACQLMLAHLRRERPAHVAIVFDSGQVTFRTRLDPRYKANRGDPPADLEPQFDLLREAVAALGFLTIGVPDFEADDLMATLARHARDAGLGTRLVSPDKDLCQLVVDAAPPVRVHNPRSGEVLDEAGVAERVGVAPAKVVDFMALVGDTSDNVPGVRGIGPKAAQALLECFADLDAIYRGLDRVEYLGVRGAKSLAKKLEVGKDEALLARRLVALVDDVPLPFPAASLRQRSLWTGPLDDQADAVFQRLDSHSVLRGARGLAERLQQQG